ncbi:right-handed parallel beta-helix repeat-containing protein [Acinetobacter baumannii]|uniref:right-handed parallel beta-helix repeat-containing protein n=1 Tax=Acinetobacter baumannii TaxID=470 RepID=UPI003891AA84
MAVPEQTPFIEYTANGTTTVFPVPFQCDKAEYLIVNLDGNEAPVGSWSFVNGSVTFNTAPANGVVVNIERNTPFQRTTDYQSYNNSFRPSAVNKDFDLIWWKLQELGYRDQVIWLALVKEIADRIAGDDNLQNQINTIDEWLANLQQNVNENTNDIAQLVNDLSKEIADRITGDQILKDMFLSMIDEAINEGTINALAVTHVDSLEGLNAISNVWDGRTIYVKDLGNYRYDATLSQWVLVYNKAESILDSSGLNQQQINSFLTGLLVSPEFFTGTDSSKLQQALDTGETVVIAKPYTINTQLNMTVENTKVVFVRTGKITTTVNQNILNMYADNCKVLNAKLEGFGSPSTILYTGTGITLHGVKGCEVSYAKITKTGGCPIALLAQTVGGIVKSCVDNVIAYNDLDCDFETKRTYDSAGILIGYSHYHGEGYSHDNNHIYANRVRGNALIDHGIAMIGHGKGNRFTQNTISDCLEYGIVVYQSPYIDNTLYDNIVSGNKINNIGHVSDNLGIKGMGIYLQKSDSTVVHGNIIDNVLLGTNNDTNLSRAAIAVAGCVGVVVSDNIIENSKQFGIQFSESYGCKATNNFMDKVTLDLIRITSSSKIDIIGNTGLNGGGYGVYVYNFNRTTGRADYNGTSGNGINIVGNDLNCVSEGVWSSSSNAENKMIDSRIDSNLIKTPAISIYVANAANTSITSNKCKSTTNLARIQVLESDKLTVNCNAIESTAATDSGRIVLNNATNYVVEGNLFSPSNSTTPIYINGQGFKAAKKRLYGTGIPSVGTYEVGDIIWNTSPVLAGPLGWVCVTAGSPGTWAQFGEVGGTMVSLTTTSLQSATNAINTVGKYAGKEVFNQTDSKKYYAEGATATSRWMRFDSGASITPA